MIIGAAVALVMALVVVGGIALVSSLKSESAAPKSSSSESGPERVLSKGEAKDKAETVYAKIEVVGESVDIYAAAPGNTEVYWDGQWTQDDVSNVIWKDLDLTISDTSAVKVTVEGKRLQLPPEQSVTIQFVEGKPEVIE